MHPRIVKCMQVDALLCVGFIKTMPAFERLMPEDKLLLFRHIALPFAILANSHASYELGSGTWQRKTSGPMIGIFVRGKKKADKRLSHLADKFLTKSLEPFSRAAISREEYSLLLAILISQNAAIPTLSDEARELLGTESARYSKILLCYLQCRLGSMEAGAKRFAECIHLVNHCFQHVHHAKNFFTYMEIFYMQNCTPSPNVWDFVMSA